MPVLEWLGKEQNVEPTRLSPSQNYRFWAGVTSTDKIYGKHLTKCFFLYLNRNILSIGFRCQMHHSVGRNNKPLTFSPAQTILGDPGAVSRVGRKGGTKVFKYGRKSPWVPTLTGLFPKNSSGCRLLIGHTKWFVLLCPIGEQFLLSSSSICPENFLFLTDHNVS